MEESGVVRSSDYEYLEDDPFETGARSSQATGLNHNYPPLSRSLHGSSDPFNAQPVPVPARANQAVAFVRTYYLSCWMFSFMLQLGEEKARSRVLSLAHGGHQWLWNVHFQEPINFWAAIACGMPLLQRLLPEDTRYELERIRLLITTRSLSRIREQMQDLGEARIPPDTLVSKVLSAFAGSAMSADVKGARITLKTFRNLIERMRPEGRNIKWFRVALWGDATSAVLQMRRPILDHESWIPNVLAPVWEEGDSILFQVKPDGNALSAFLPNPPLIEAFSFARKAIEASRVKSAPWRGGDARQTDLICHYTKTKAEHHKCCLLNLYFDLIERKPSAASHLTESDCHFQTALTLSLLYIIHRTFTDSLQDNGADFHESASIILPRLRSEVECASPTSSMAERKFWQSAYLWIYYVGSYAEERVSRNRCGFNNLSQTWFHRKLAREGVQAGLSTWEQAKPILERVFFSSSLSPHPKTWYEETVMQYRDVN